MRGAQSATRAAAVLIAAGIVCLPGSGLAGGEIAAPPDTGIAKGKPAGRGLLRSPKWERTVNGGISLARKSDFAPAVRSDAWNLVWGLEDRFGYRTAGWSLRTGYGIHHSGRYTLYDYGRLEAEYHPNAAAAWHAGVRAGGAYTRANGKAGGASDVHAGYGLELGAWVEGPWERLEYAYNTGAGGYHRLDLMFAGRGGPSRSQMGTIYSLYFGEYVQMLRIGLYLHALPGTEEELSSSRPLPLKALAYGVFVFPLLPLTLLFLLLRPYMA